jgi:predicted nucleic acid-binding protein
VNLFIDTSIWSLAFRRDAASDAAEVLALRQALEGGDTIVTTGLILQELLQGFSGPRARKDIIDRFSALPLLMPDRQDHIDAAVLRNKCRRSGVQLGTIDALLAQLHTSRIDAVDHRQGFLPRRLTLPAAGVEAIAIAVAAGDRRPRSNTFLYRFNRHLNFHLCAFGGECGPVIRFAPYGLRPLTIAYDWTSLASSTFSRFSRRVASRMTSSKMATARVHPADAPRILWGKHEIMKPVGGSASRLCSFSR